MGFRMLLYGLANPVGRVVGLVEQLLLSHASFSRQGHSVAQRPISCALDTGAFGQTAVCQRDQGQRSHTHVADVPERACLPKAGLLIYSIFTPEKEEVKLSN